MALTVAQKYDTVPGDTFLRLYEITFDSSYPTGGEALTASDLGVNDLVEVLAIMDAVVGQDAHALWDRDNGKLVLQVVSTGAEAANGSDQSSVKVLVLALVR